MTINRIALIHERLTKTLAPEVLEIHDDGHLHIGHAGASNGGHFTVRIVASAFENMPLIERHRMIYDSLHDMMHGEIHALSIQANSPNEIHPI